MSFFRCLHRSGSLPDVRWQPTKARYTPLLEAKVDVSGFLLARTELLLVFSVSRGIFKKWRPGRLDCRRPSEISGGGPEMAEKDENLENEIEEGFLSEDEWDDDWDDDADDDLVSYVCEDCDYRWDETSEEENESVVCPMCGSDNVTQL